MIRLSIISLMLVCSFSLRAQEVHLAVQKGHSDAIELLEFSRTGRWLASKAANNEVIIWDTKLSKTMGAFTLHQSEPIIGMKFHADESKLKIRSEARNYESDVYTSELVPVADKDTVFRQKTYYLDEGTNFEVFVDNGGAIKKKRLDKKFKKYKLAVHYLHAPFAAFDIHKEKNLIIGVAADEQIYVHNYRSGLKMKVLSGHNSEILDVRFTKDGKYFATASKDRSIIIWRTRDFRIEKRLHSNVFQKKTACFSQDGFRIYVGDELGYIYAIDMNAVFPKISVTQPNLHSVNKIIRSKDGKGYYIASSNNYVYYKENLSLKKPQAKYAYRDNEVTEWKKLMLQAGFDVYTEPFGEVEVLEFSPDGKRIVYTGKSDIPNIAYADLAKGKVKHVYNYYSDDKWAQWEDVDWITNDRFVSVLDSSNILYHWDISHKRKVKVKTDTLPFIVKNFKAIGENKLWINAQEYGQVIYDTEKREFERKDAEQGQDVFKWRDFIIYVSDDYELVFYDLSKDAFHHRFKGHSSDITDINFHPDNNHFLTSSDDGTIKLWSFKNRELIVTIIPFRNEEFVFITNDNYYLITKGAMEEIGFRKEGEFFFPEQFDLKYNRPDLVLEQMGFTDDELLKAYNKAYKKRLKKYHFTEDQLSAEFQLPVAEIVNINAIPAMTDRGDLDLHLKFADAMYKLDRINIWVNDVAIKGKDGIDLRDDDVRTFEGTFKIDLANGFNKIEVSVLNQKGVESYKQAVTIESTAGKKKPNLYLLTLGVSKFKDSNYNLEYAAKDAKDMSTAFATNTYFAEVKAKSFTNEEVTLEKLEDMRRFLEQADINDVVMVFVAGHGVLDNNFDYYFASHDMDFRDPATRGIPYESVEGLLDGISALKKLLFLDTCHSGEVDKDDLIEVPTPSEEEGDLNFRHAGLSVAYRDELEDGGGDESKFGLRSINELMKTVFADLRKGTGATVISSSGGAELSIESEEYNNGLFTYCLINGLTNNLADLNKDKEIDVSELQRYIRDEVTRLSQGKQTPTSRITNDELNYRLW